MRILVVEDEPKTAAYLRKGLSEHGYVVEAADNGIDGLQLALHGQFDLVLLDLMLAGLDGLSLLRQLRAQRNTPVLVLSARDTVDDRVAGLQLGADDYLVKPFAFSELLARVQTLLRRSQQRVDMVLHVDDLEVDLARRRVTRAGRRIDLTAKEFALLDYFVRHTGRVLSRTLIAEHVWGLSFDSDTNVVDVTVRRLRAKIDDGQASKLVHTLRGVGYIFEFRAA
ncbi:heavy metal response regulator transcription factor [Pseudorhodoferax sp.]|uniref:heavy metal response regulator transcription factor n=1 Tax=Pseudorhodoferax sp. TaxID=1993553 RepID=UPI002DD63875|nr:heavy metal response regulator transcription factor [Pseudorhodoferax sp.]